MLLRPDHQLYNGNISAWQTAGAGGELAFQYRYDHLNRLLASQRQQRSAGQWQDVAAHGTSYQYDGNGNIVALCRQDETGADLDQLGYSYKPGTNQLAEVQDGVSTPSQPDDLEGTHRYAYDQIGNLTRDDGEGIEVAWDVYGKVSGVTPLGPLVANPLIGYRWNS